MASAYQPTTVRNDEIDEGDESTAFCNPFHSRRQVDLEVAHHHQRKPRRESDDRQDRVNQW